MKKSGKILYNILKKGLVSVLSVVIISGVSDTIHVNAQEIKEPDQKSYTYSYWGAPAESADPYVVEKVITGEDLGCGNFKEPLDVFRAKDGKLYIADTGNNRIIVLNKDGEFLKEFKGAADGADMHEFNSPQGVFVTDNNEIYVADTKNGLIVHMDSQGKLIRILEKPAGAVISDTMVYAPSHVVVDKDGLIYVVSLYVNQGIIEYSSDGNFDGFLAAGKVNPNPIEVFWKKFSTQAQRNRMVDFVPIEYNNIAIDNDGFIYATMAAMNKNVVLAEIASKNGTEEGTLVRKLNMLGNDILRQEGFYPPVGDVDVMNSNLNFYGAYPGISTIVDVSFGDYGIFSILDSNRKRIFTYDGEGNLLYAFGGAGTASGGFMTPVSLAQSEENMYILDKATGALTVFKLTDYGAAIHDAIALSETGQYNMSAEKWQEVLKRNANMDLAYTGIGKALFRSGDYKEAMRYFKSGYNKDWYSKAYQEYRKTKIASGFPILAILLILVFLTITAKKIYMGLKRFLKGGAA